MRRAAWLALSALVCACEEAENKTTETQVTLTVETDDALRTQLDSLRATLFVQEATGWTRRSQVEVASDRLRALLDIPIIAREGADESAPLEVVVEAYAAGQRLAQTRVVSRFRKAEHTRIETRLFACSGRERGFVCASDDCHGDSCAVCNDRGDCVALVPTEGAPTDASMPSERDAAARDASSDAGTSDAAQVDVQVDAGQDGGGSDAGAPDASMSGSGCPAVHECRDPYPCVPTPLGYTCRGQYADWPMPDATEGAKVKPDYSATPDVVTDNVTKLQWQSGIPRIYTGCTERIDNNDGTFSDPGELCTRAQGRAYCDQLVHGGFDDWRLPSFIELVSLFDSQRDSGRFGIDTNYFADTEWGPFISDSVYAGGPSQAWSLNYFARASFVSGNYAAKVRCVRAGAPPPFAKPSERYAIDEAADTVTDRATGLRWQRKPVGLEHDEASAATACAAPWRLPTANELLTLVAITSKTPAIDVAAFPDTPPAWFWTSLNSAYLNRVSFGDGSLEMWAERAYVRCVR